MAAFTVNAYNNVTDNEIIFPAAILQPPLFDVTADDASNYGALGTLIGHEITHAFDNEGREYDRLGNVRDWWTPADAKAFIARTQRLVEQYGNYIAIEGDTVHVNGKLTLGENIADLAGAGIAHEAYRIALTGAPAPDIDGFTGDQRFFLGYAQIWRSKIRDEALRQRLLSDPHSPAKYRVNGVIPNLTAFQDAFTTAPTDPMFKTADQRIVLW